MRQQSLELHPFLFTSTEYGAGYHLAVKSSEPLPEKVEARLSELMRDFTNVRKFPEGNLSFFYLLSGWAAMLRIHYLERDWRGRQGAYVSALAFYLGGLQKKEAFLSDYFDPVGDNMAGLFPRHDKAVEHLREAVRKSRTAKQVEWQPFSIDPLDPEQVRLPPEEERRLHDRAVYAACQIKAGRPLVLHKTAADWRFLTHLFSLFGFPTRFERLPWSWGGSPAFLELKRKPRILFLETGEGVQGELPVLPEATDTAGLPEEAQGLVQLARRIPEGETLRAFFNDPVKAPFTKEHAERERKDPFVFWRNILKSSRHENFLNSLPPEEFTTDWFLEGVDITMDRNPEGLRAFLKRGLQPGQWLSKTKWFRNLLRGLGDAPPKVRDTVATILTENLGDTPENIPDEVGFAVCGFCLKVYGQIPKDLIVREDIQECLCRNANELEKLAGKLGKFFNLAVKKGVIDRFVAIRLFVPAYGAWEDKEARRIAFDTAAPLLLPRLPSGESRELKFFRYLLKSLAENKEKPLLIHYLKEEQIASYEEIRKWEGKAEKILAHAGWKSKELSRPFETALWRRHPGLIAACSLLTLLAVGSLVSFLVFGKSPAEPPGNGGDPLRERDYASKEWREHRNNPSPQP